jgi:RNA-binding protein
MSDLTSKQRAQLRGLANGIDTILIVGKEGVTEAVAAQANEALEARELIKGRVLETALMTAREVAEELAPATRSEVMAAAEVYRAKIIDYKTDYMCIEVTGDPGKIIAFTDVMRPLGIIEMCRTGVIALERGGNIMDK